MIERSAFTDINRYLPILTNTYSNYKEYWLISVNIGLLNFQL